MIFLRLGYATVVYNNCIHSYSVTGLIFADFVFHQNILTFMKKSNWINYSWHRCFVALLSLKRFEKKTGAENVWVRR